MRVLVTGAGGQLGRELLCAFGDDDVIGTTRATLDITDRDSVLGTVTSLRPDVVVNAAAWTDVDACESDPERAYLVNALGVRWLAEACRRADSHLVQISTDYVFDGEKGAPYHEWDLPKPVNVYGASKLAGEREAGPAATVVRTAWLFSDDGPGIVQTVLRLLASDQAMRFVVDQSGSPTYVPDLAAAVVALARRRITGVVHVANEGSMTALDLARFVVEDADGDPAQVTPIASAEMDRAAARPSGSALACGVLASTGIHVPGPARPRLAQAVRATLDR